MSFSILEMTRLLLLEKCRSVPIRYVPLAQLPAEAARLDPDADWVVVCASGYRSMIATSVLERAGFARVTSGAGGMDAWQRDGMPVANGA